MLTQVNILFKILSHFLYLDLVGLLHVGVFILLVLSGERNFGVRLNKPYVGKSSVDIPRFTGTHADLLFLVSCSVQ